VFVANSKCVETKSQANRPGLGNLRHTKRPTCERTILSFRRPRHPLHRLHTRLRRPGARVPEHLDAHDDGAPNLDDANGSAVLMTFCVPHRRARCAPIRQRCTRRRPWPRLANAQPPSRCAASTAKVGQPKRQSKGSTCYDSSPPASKHILYHRTKAR